MQQAKRFAVADDKFQITNITHLIVGGNFHRNSKHKVGQMDFSSPVINNKHKLHIRRVKKPR